MPENESIIIRSEDYFQWKYQQWKVSFDLVKAEGNTRDIQRYEVVTTMEQVRAASIPNMGFEVNSSEPFAPYLKTRTILVKQGEAAPSPRHLPAAKRKEFRTQFKDAVWSRYIYATANNRQMQQFATNIGHSDVRFVVDKVSHKFVDFVATTQEDWKFCGNDIDECEATHFAVRGTHISTTVNNRLVPREQTSDFGYTDLDGQHQTATWWLYDPELMRVSSGYVTAEMVQSELGLGTCSWCSRYIHRELLSEPGLNRNRFCPTCVADLEQCARCEQMVPGGQLREGFFFDDEAGDYISADICGRCATSISEERLNLQAYSTKHDLVFYRKDNGIDPLFMGMELEVAREHRANTPQVNKWIMGLDRSFFLVKGDSSVTNGMEVVTQPFTYEWAKDEFPYEVFDDLLTIDGVYPSHSSAGTHIHLSKAAFDITHMWKFILFFIENKEFFGKLGGRGHAANYGSFEGDGIRNLRTNLLEIVKNKGNAAPLGISVGRGAVNISPEDTIEMRFLAGNVKPANIKKNQQLMKAAYDFTKEVKAGDAMKGALADPGYFIGFLEDFDYPELLHKITKSFPVPKKLERTI